MGRCLTLYAHLGACLVSVSLALPHIFRLLFLVLLAAGDVHRQVSFHTLGPLNWRVHRDVFVVRDDNNDVLREVLGPLALQQDVVDVLLLHGDFEAHVLVLHPAAQLKHELTHCFLL